MVILNKRFPNAIAIVLVLLGIAAMGLTGIALGKKNNGLLNGKIFTINYWVKGKTQQHADVIIFDNGVFTCAECKQNGFEKAKYTASKKNNTVTFEAKTVSANEGTVHWQGTIEGNIVSGTYVWTKSGQKEITYRFKGSQENVKKSNTCEVPLNAAAAPIPTIVITDTPLGMCQ